MGTTDWDVEINGTGHFLYPNNEYRYSRDAISVERDQIDTSSEPGEQSLTSWWYRSQSSFHLGMGQEWFDTVRGNDTDQYRFDDAYGMKPWTKGEVVLQPQAKVATTKQGVDQDWVVPLTTLGKPAQFATSDGKSGVVYCYNNTIYKMEWRPSAQHMYAEPLTMTHKDGVDPNPVSKVLDVCTMGDYAWFWCLTSTDSRIEIRRTQIKDGANTKTYWYQTLSGLGVNNQNDNYRTARISFRNSVLAATYGRYWWAMPNPETVTTPELLAPTIDAQDGVLNRLLFKHPDPDYCFLDVARTNGPIAACGTQVSKDDIIFGNRSQVWACLAADEQSSEDKNVVEMDPPFVTAETPAGEQIFRMDVSMNFIFLGTSTGLRVAEMDTKGDILIGPPHETDGPVFDCCNYGQFVWFTGSETGGVYRLDLRNAVNRQSYTFAYARDGELGSHDTTANQNKVQAGELPDGGGGGASHVEMFGNSAGPVWFFSRDGANGRWYATWEFEPGETGHPAAIQTRRQDYGWIRTPRIRMDTWEFKLFQYLRTLWDPQRVTAPGEGSIKPSWIPTRGGTPENLLEGEEWHTCDLTGFVDTVGSYPNGHRGPLLDVGYHFMLWDQPDGDQGTEKDPAFKGYQVKAKPTNVADKELQLPLLCARRERMRQGRTVERSTWERVRELEKLQRTGEIVDYKNLGTGEEGKVIVDSCQFVSTYVPQSKQEQEDRLGIVLVKLRIVESEDYVTPMQIRRDAGDLG